MVEWRTQCDPPEVREGRAEMRQALIIQKAHQGPPTLVESRIVAKVPGLKGALVSLTATLGACRVFWQVHRVNTWPDLVGHLQNSL